jgi:hypothetical protein
LDFFEEEQKMETPHPTMKSANCSIGEHHKCQQHLNHPDWRCECLCHASDPGARPPQQHKNSDDDPLEDTERRLKFVGAAIATQRLRIETAQLSDLCGDFVCVYHSHGDDSVTNMLFTNEEARYLSETLLKIISAWSKP